MTCRRWLVAIVVSLLALTSLTPWTAPRPSGAQGVDVFLNVTGGGTRKLNIAVPEFALVAGTDTGGLRRELSTVVGADLTFSGQFSVVSSTGAIPANDPGRPLAALPIPALGATPAPRAVIAPGVTPAQVQYYVDLFAKVVATPEWKKLMEEGAFNTTSLKGKEYADWVAKEEARHISLMKAAGFIAGK